MSVKEFSRRDAVTEGTDSQYACVFVESAVGQPQLNAAAIATITATLKDLETGAVINGRDAQNVKGVNGGTLAADGIFTLQLGALDNVLVTPTNALEGHRLTLEVTFTRAGGGAGALNHEVRFFVRNLADV